MTDRRYQRTHARTLEHLNSRESASRTRHQQVLRRDGFVRVARQAAAGRHAQRPRPTASSLAEATVPMLVRPDGHVAWAGLAGPTLDEMLERFVHPGGEDHPTGTRTGRTR